MEMPTRILRQLKVHETITRKFPSEANIHVKVGDIVTPDTIVADYLRSSGFRVFHVAQELGIPAKQLEKYITKAVGKRVYEGEIIAQKKRLLGKPKVFKTVVDGVIESIGHNGDVTLSMLPQKVTEAALFWGKVTAVETVNQVQQVPDGVQVPAVNDVVVAIETQVVVLYGIMGSGAVRNGRISVVASATDFVLPQAIEAGVDDTIIVCGSLVEHGVLEKAIKSNAKGIIAGGIHFRDAQAMGIRTPDSSMPGTDIGASIVITQGFGSVGISEVHYALLLRFAGRFGVIDGNNSTITIPIKEEEVEQIRQIASETLVTATTIAVGQKARILETPEFGKVGTITAIEDNLTTLPSGVQVQMVTLELLENQEKVSVPITNFELLG